MVAQATLTNGRADTTRGGPAGWVFPDLQGLYVPRPVYLSNGWGVEIVGVWPDLAAAMQLTNCDNQRKRRPNLFERYAADMRADDFPLTHQAIAFNRAGELFDGQNRLEGVILAVATVQFVVFYGVGGSREMAVTDTGGVRTVMDAVKVAGLELGTRDVSVLRNMHKFGTGSALVNPRSLSHSEIFDLAGRHAELMRWLDATFQAGKLSQRLCSSPVKAAVGLAYYHVDRDRLARFVSVLIDETPASRPGDGTAKYLRHWLTTIAGGGTSRVEGLDVFLRTVRAIELFLAGTDVSRMYAAPANPWPLPA